MKRTKILIISILFVGIQINCNKVNAKNKLFVSTIASSIEVVGNTNYSSDNSLNNKKVEIERILINKDKVFATNPWNATSIYVEYKELGKAFKLLEKYDVNITTNARVTRFRNNLYQVVIHEIDRGTFTEINGELESLSQKNSCLTLRIIFPLKGKNWEWYSGLEKTNLMNKGTTYEDVLNISTVLPPDGAFNGRTLTDGGYGDSVGQGTMSYYPLGAVTIDNKGEAIGIDMSIPMVYRLSAKRDQGLKAEFDVATSPLTEKFPNRAFFKLSHFNFDANWGMRAALKKYYSIYPESFKKRVITEGVWLPFTALRSIPNWEDFGFAFHETNWKNMDTKDGRKLPNILSDKGTGVYSFQYTEPWDLQLPILTKNIAYDSLVSSAMIPSSHMSYLQSSSTEDKNGLWQTRRLETPWFSSGWAVSITTNCDPDITGYNRYQYVNDDEILPAIKLNTDGVYFDSMEWNWHHDLNYRKDHFKYTDYPLVFSKDVGRPAIWNFVSEFEFMKKTADDMHLQGKLVMGNGHGWNPFAAANLDLFGAELNWYSTDAHNSETLDFKRAISFQKPIVFLLNEGLNDKAFTDYPFNGYEIYFEKLMAYGFFPSFFSVDASSNPYWKDSKKIENGRSFFKKYIPIIKQISETGWEPVTDAVCNDDLIRIERFGERLFTVRNNGNKDKQCVISLDLIKLKLFKEFSAIELVGKQAVKVENNELHITVPKNRTLVIELMQ